MNTPLTCRQCKKLILYAANGFCEECITDNNREIANPAPAVKGPAILTTRLNKWGHNQLVLAKSAGYAYTYANRTQAGKKAAALQAAGIACHVTAFYPFYIAIEES